MALSQFPIKEQDSSQDFSLQCLRHSQQPHHGLYNDRRLLFVIHLLHDEPGQMVQPVAHGRPLVLALAAFGVPSFFFCQLVAVTAHGVVVGGEPFG
jgi:hypothetical protein